MAAPRLLLLLLQLGLLGLCLVVAASEGAAAAAVVAAMGAAGPAPLAQQGLQLAEGARIAGFRLCCRGAVACGARALAVSLPQKAVPTVCAPRAAP